MSNAPTPVIRIETGTSDTASFSAIAEEAVRTLRFIGFTATKRTSGGIARIDLAIPAPVEPDSYVTTVAWSEDIALNWANVPYGVAQVTMPENMPDTEIVPSGMIEGATYTLILKHPLGGLAANGMVWTNGHWLLNSVFTTNFAGDPGEVLVLQCVAIGGNLVQIGGNNFSI